MDGSGLFASSWFKASTNTENHRKVDGSPSDVVIEALRDKRRADEQEAEGEHRWSDAGTNALIVPPPPSR
jgi:hypothetical protein